MDTIYYNDAVHEWFCPAFLALWRLLQQQCSSISACGCEQSVFHIAPQKVSRGMSGDGGGGAKNVGLSQPFHPMFYAENLSTIVT